MLSDVDSRRSTFYCPACREPRYIIPPPPDPNWAFCGACGTQLSQNGPSYAGFWIRFVGYLIDTVLVYAATFALLIPLSLALSLEGGWDYLLSLGIAVGYPVIGNGRGGTLGKRAVGLRCVDDDGRPPGYRRAFVRWLVSIVSALAFLAGYILMAFDREKQTWHDAIAGTYVVQK